MSRNGSGGYSLPVNSWNPAVNGVSATAADWQSLINDVATAIQQSVSADGQTPITGNLAMGGNKLTGLSAGVGTGQSLRFEQLFSQGTLTSIASAATTDIGAQLSNFLQITGTTTITSFGTNYNGPRFLIFSGALLLTHSATLVLQGAANITTAANDCAIAIPISGGWQVVAYQRASGFPVVTTGFALSGANTDITSLGGLTSAVAEVRQIQPISASVAASALTISASALALEFRSTTLGSGTVSFVKGTPANLVVPSTATLGTTSASLSRLAVLAINNAGTIELAVVNALGGTDLSESGVISTTSISVASNSASVIYSTNARTNVAYRVIGYIESTQATAGTWATSPSTIQGQGGNALQGVPRMQQSPSVTASGTSVDFTGIAPWAREIVIPLAGISTNGSSSICVQIGDIGGIETTGYTATGNNVAGSVAITSTAAVPIMVTATAASVYSGHIFLNLVDPATNLWAISAVLSDSSPTIQLGCGSKALSGPLDRVRITTLGGVNTFDAGTLSATSKGY